MEGGRVGVIEGWGGMAHMHMYRPQTCTWKAEIAYSKEFLGLSTFLSCTVGKYKKTSLMPLRMSSLMERGIS